MNISATDWVEPMRGPLVVVPVSALDAWRGWTDDRVVREDGAGPDDYDRACGVKGLAGVIGVGGDGAQALVLGDEPAASCFVAERRVFLRWLAADSEAGLIAAAEAVLTDPGTPWEECGTWVTEGPAVLMNSADTGVELSRGYPGGGRPEQAPVPLPAGVWRIRAVHARADERSWVGLVQVLPAAG
ncbi:Imm21 family immunity protein [Streptomyces sp. NPDC021020]|uniref:Imm21 family immunity protein n=1 Tax=Streptomyces sp. NPDC021020 TaxID=3365109 RepID=UPI00378AD670